MNYTMDTKIMHFIRFRTDIFNLDKLNGTAIQNGKLILILDNALVEISRNSNETPEEILDELYALISSCK